MRDTVLQLQKNSGDACPWHCEDWSTIASACYVAVYNFFDLTRIVGQREYVSVAVA